MSLTLECGACETLMARLPTASVDTIITDTPYNTTELAFDQVKLDWDTWWQEARRVVKPSGLIVMFAADLFTIDLIGMARDIYRYRLVWEKTRSTGFLDANRRPLRTHEDIVVFSEKFRGSTYNPQKRPAERYTSPTVRKGPTGDTHWGGNKQHGEWRDDGTRHPTSVLRFASVNSQTTIHPTQKPLDLMKFLVASFTNEGDLILDPCMGSGSTGEACVQLARRFHGMELNPAYFEVARQRLHGQPSALLSAG